MTKSAFVKIFIKHSASGSRSLVSTNVNAILEHSLELLALREQMIRVAFLRFLTPPGFKRCDELLSWIVLIC